MSGLRQGWLVALRELRERSRSGGFRAGLQRALDRGAAWVWAMDDDGRARDAGCLGTLLATAEARGAELVGALVVDVDEPERLARFYAALLDVPIVDENERWWTIRLPDGRHLDFQLNIGYRPPTADSTEVPQQFHLDLMVDDLPAAIAYAESLGARRIERLGGTSVAFVDPSGHPFCLCRRPA